MLAVMLVSCKCPPHNLPGPPSWWPLTPQTPPRKKKCSVEISKSFGEIKLLTVTLKSYILQNSDDGRHLLAEILEKKTPLHAEATTMMFNHITKMPNMTKADVVGPDCDLRPFFIELATAKAENRKDWCEVPGFEDSPMKGKPIWKAGATAGLTGHYMRGAGERGRRGLVGGGPGCRGRYSSRGRRA